MVQIQKLKRNFIPQDLQIQSWEIIEPYFSGLEKLQPGSEEEIENWLAKRSELEAILEEDLAWRYIRMNCDTQNEEYTGQFRLFISKIEPEINKYHNILDKKVSNSVGFQKLNHKQYFVYKRSLKKKLEIFREENIPIIAELQEEEQEYGKAVSQMTVTYEGKEHTLQQAANYLKETNRDIREEVYHLINARRLEKVADFHALFDSLLQKRHKIAMNAGFENFRDYKFADLGRFDYTVEDCLEFHKAIAEEVVPLVEELHQQRKVSLKLEKLKPWDLDVDENLSPPLKPFKTAEELIERTIRCFAEIRPEYGEYIRIMNEKNYLDLDSRKGKAPGGFNYPLYESNVPFIFMNATGNLRDLETMVHEGGHAIHSFLSAHIQLMDYKSLPSEVAELASMSMELISMEHWHHFFPSGKDWKRARRSQLQGIIGILPWIASIDRFQHYLYTHPLHTHQDRDNAWIEISREFMSPVVDWKGVEESFVYAWQKQLHIFEVPFYYIEYGIAQLGAIAVWKNYKENPQKALDQYEAALKLGYSVPIPEIYETAGIKFDFSREYVKELMHFVGEELKKLGT